MAKAKKPGVTLVRDDDYEEIAMTFQRVLVMEVDDALRSAGIKDVEKRKAVCEHVSFGFGNFLDQYWFRVNGKQYYPLLCFSETFLNTDTDVNDLGTVYAPSPSFAYHEYSGGDVEAHFAKKPDDPLEVGLVGDDEPLEEEEDEDDE